MYRLFALLVLGVALIAGCANGGATKECTTVEDCPASTTECATATCSPDGACVMENAALRAACSDSDGTLCNGNGQCVQCTDAGLDCPLPASECEEASCNAGSCDMTLVAQGAQTVSQVGGDCKSVVCDGMGSPMAINADDPPDDNNDCTTDACANGSSAPTNVAAGTTCATAGGQVCGSGTKLGTCVECLNNTHCTGGKVCDTVSDHFLCVAPSCTDLMPDGMETDTDCGGPTCSPCSNTKTCALARDCASGYCAGTTCAACTTNAHCPAASYCDVPSGTCKPDKADGGTCTNDDMQCTNGHCVDGVCCNSTCTTGCQACSAAKKGSGSDGVCGNIALGNDPDMECAGTYSCNGSAVCQSCTDGSKNGAETDMDCGGPTCNKCVDGKMCTTGTDCMSGSCPSGTCVAATTCGNGTIGSGEQCDDGGTAPNDGCSATCQCEATRVKTLTSIGVSVPDDAYNGTLASMVCVNVAMPSVTGCATTVTSVKATLGMSHSWVGDLVVKLVSPPNTTVTLMSRPGFAEPADDGTSGFGNGADLLAAFPVTFLSGGPTSAESMGASVNYVCQSDGLCMFSPSPGTLASFNGQTIAGTWRLCVGDSSGGDVGTIDRVTLTITN